MHLVAIVLALILERVLSGLLHLRDGNWMGPWFDWVIPQGERSRRALPLFLVLAIAVPLAPVLAVDLLIGERLYGIPGLVFAVVVLVISLGPRDLIMQIKAYRNALHVGDEAAVQALAEDLLDGEAPAHPADRGVAVARAILIEANNRVFGVMLWFFILGPVGAWAFRLIESSRHRFRRSRRDPILAAWMDTVHGLVAWIPARLLAAGYALAGSFEDAVSDWRDYYGNCAGRFFQINDDVVACSGGGAMGGTGQPGDAEAESALARRALNLVKRTLLLWLGLFALLTLGGLVD